MSRKFCAKCGIDKPLLDFHVNKRLNDGRHSYCKDCVKAYYRANADRIKQKAVTWRKENPERYAEYQKQWLKENGTAYITRYQRERRKSDPVYAESIRRYQRERYQRQKQANHD